MSTQTNVTMADNSFSAEILELTFNFVVALATASRFQEEIRTNNLKLISSLQGKSIEMCTVWYYALLGDLFARQIGTLNYYFVVI